MRQLPPMSRGGNDDACHTWEEHIANAASGISDGESKVEPLMSDQCKDKDWPMKGAMLCQNKDIHPQWCSCVMKTLVKGKQVEKKKNGMTNLHPEMPKLILHWLNSHVPMKYRGSFL